MYHEGAVAMADFEQPDRAERHERFSQRRTANVQVAGEVAFGRQALAELESAIDDAGDQARGNVVGQPRAVYRTKRRALGRALVVGHRRTAAPVMGAAPISLRLGHHTPEVPRRTCVAARPRLGQQLPRRRSTTPSRAGHAPHLFRRYARRFYRVDAY